MLYCVQTVEGTPGEGLCFGFLRSFLPLLERLGDSGELSEVPEAKSASACSPAVTRVTSINRSLPVRSSVRTRTLDPFNKHDRWGSLGQPVMLVEGI